MMMPLTAAKLKERRKNTLKDFVSVAGPLGVTHMMCFASTGVDTPQTCYHRAPLHHHSVYGPACALWQRQ